MADSVAPLEEGSWAWAEACICAGALYVAAKALDSGTYAPPGLSTMVWRAHNLLVKLGGVDLSPELGQLEPEG